MKICDFKGYEMHLPTSGGKAGKGNQKTSTIQVRGGGQIVAAFRFEIASKDSMNAAIQRAKDYATQHPPAP